MCVWKKIAILAVVLTGSVNVVQAEAAKQKKHLVDMADGMNQQEFYDAKNPDALWSSDGAAPWTRSEAVNAWEQDGSGKSTTVKGDAVNAWETKDDGKSRPAVVVENMQTGEVKKPAASVLLENGKPVEAGRAINVRVRYTVDPEHSKALFSPVSAQGELYRQMSGLCNKGFQKMSEWSTPIEGGDYYLFYQFRCMDTEQQ